ncbi:hypothetical protein TRP8649_03288 [Pelagimonas phthalicica]|uniref:DUF1353 domain-containing protein n=1 Tax=Pelagimonas phthalicica TaxID=1037362 RepID=A0A238JFG9_9RHOB|nr:DUF1353 domain-containing protein [Pelagimonas phthalicica]TDS92105.1 uncharacterized protein DUF1353 [Pelagimonas phthalicica]SMX29155.1 hypothetical protein TRP8649_03288 [Pelagimonas phthalicica]
MPDLSWCKKGGARGYVTAQPVPWQIGKKDSGWELLVPAGREFESSVPRQLGWLFSPDDPYFLKAACIHDYLIECGYRRAFADSQWFEAALSEQAPELRARLAYLAMRLRLFAIWAVGRKRRK